MSNQPEISEKPAVDNCPDEPVKTEALRAIANLERLFSHPYSAQLVDLAADEIDRLRAAIAAHRFDTQHIISKTLGRMRLADSTLYERAGLDPVVRP